MNRELLKQALDALKYHTANTYPFHLTNVAIEALKKELAKPEQESEAFGYAKRLAEFIWAKHYKNESPNWTPLPDVLGVLTQIDNMTCGLEKATPEQEPVATVKFIHNKKAPDVDWHCNICIRDGAKLYTAPPRKEWVGLTNEDWENTPDTGKQGCERDAELFDWIEQTLKDKNEPSR